MSTRIAPSRGEWIRKMVQHCSCRLTVGSVFSTQSCTRAHHWRGRKSIHSVHSSPHFTHTSHHTYLYNMFTSSIINTTIIIIRVRGKFLIYIHDNPTTQFIGSSSFTYIHHYRYASFCSSIFIVYLVLFIPVLLSFFFFLSIFSHVRHPTHQHLNPTHTVCIDHHNITSKVYLSILTYFILLSFLYK